MSEDKLEFNGLPDRVLSEVASAERPVVIVRSTSGKTLRFVPAFTAETAVTSKANRYQWSDRLWRGSRTV